MNKLPVVFALLFLEACTPTTPAAGEQVSKGITIKHLQWLMGTWKSVKNNETSYETWSKKSDTILEGYSYTLIDKDTVFSEHIQLVQRGSNLFYVPAVKNQNNGAPVLFQFTEFDKGEFNFVNTEHDFPQRIIYKNPQPDFLCARIEGTKNGKFMKIDFNYLKIK